MATGPGHSPEGLGGQEGSAKPRYLLVDLRGLDAAQIGGVLDRTEQRGVPAAFVPEGFAAALGRLSFRTPEAATEDGPLATWEDLWRFMDPQLSDRELRRGSTAIWNVLSDMYWRRARQSRPSWRAI